MITKAYVVVCKRIDDPTMDLYRTIRSTWVQGMRRHEARKFTSYDEAQAVVADLNAKAVPDGREFIVTGWDWCHFPDAGAGRIRHP